MQQAACCYKPQCASPASRPEDAWDDSTALAGNAGSEVSTSWTYLAPQAQMSCFGGGSFEHVFDPIYFNTRITSTREDSLFWAYPEERKRSDQLSNHSHLQCCMSSNCAAHCRCFTLLNDIVKNFHLL
eukprot:173015-Amphidinium_carterae.1